MSENGPLPAPDSRAPWWSSAFGRLALLLWAATAVAVGCRVLHYVPFAWPDPLERLLGFLMRTQVVQLLGGFLALPVLVPISVLLVLLALLRWRSVLEVRDGRIGTRPAVLAWFTAMLFIHNVALTLDAVLFPLCWLSLLALWPGWLDRLSRGHQPARRLLLALAIGMYVLLIGGLEHELARRIMLAWLAFIVLFAGLANPRTWLRDRVWVALMASVVPQLALASLPLDDPQHGGQRIGDRDYAYNFCELPERHALYASVACDEGQNGCVRGFVAEHDTRDLTAEPIIHELLEERFDGRIVHVECIEDEVWVGMAVTRFGDEEVRENVMKFPADRPDQVVRRVFDEPFGARFVWDARHRAIYFIAEWLNKIPRLDRDTGEFDLRISDAIHGDSEGFGSHIVQTSSFHEGRDSVFFVQWLSGSRVFEVDRSRLELVQTLDPHHGGNHGIAVDEARGRVWLTSVFGVDVLDLETGELVWRHALGLGTRLPVIDFGNDRVYVTTTTGRLWVVDRNRPRILGSLLIGRGSRNAYVSLDGSRLYASAEGGYFAFDTEALRERFPDPE